MRKIFLILLFFCQVAAFSQEMAPISKKVKTALPDDTTAKHPISLQIHAGTQGLGAEVRYGVTPQFSIRAGGSTFFPVKADNYFSFSGFNADNTIKGELSNVHLLADFVPFKVKWFRLVGGAAYLFKANGGLEFIPKGNATFGGLNLTAEEVGKLNIDLSWQGVSPYVGFGLFKSFPKRSFNVNFDLGTYYLNSPKSTVVGTKLLAENKQMETQLDKNMKDYRFLPVLQVNFNFKIK